MQSDLLIAIISGVTSMLGWGTADFFTKKATEKMHEFSILFWSQVFGAIPLVLYLIISGQKFVFELNSLLPILGFAVFYGLAYALFFRGLSRGNLSIISPTLSAYGGFAVIISVILFHEQLQLGTAVSLALIFIGIILTSINWADFKNSNKISLTKGVPETLVAVAIFSFWYPIWDARLLNNANWFSEVLILRLGMALTFLCIALLTKAPLLPKKQQSGGVLKLLIAIGLLDGAGFLAFNVGFGLTSATSIITMIGSAYALPAVILAAVFLKEKLSKTQIIGILLIIVALIAINLF